MVRSEFLALEAAFGAEPTRLGLEFRRLAPVLSLPGVDLSQPEAASVEELGYAIILQRAGDQLMLYRRLLATFIPPSTEAALAACGVDRAHPAELRALVEAVTGRLWHGHGGEKALAS
jgi:hypothetical protein